MSIPTIMKRLDTAFMLRDRPFKGGGEFRGSLKDILEDFDTDILVKADDVSSGKIIQVLADIAIVVSDHRKKKIKKTEDRDITASDFVPAFGYISSLGRSRFEYRTVLDRYRNRFGSHHGIFNSEIVALVRKSCPWCDE